jgi:pyridinium-3,5-bisthiocarboxylic acid mononucleotide nickel chelatase
MANNGRTLHFDCFAGVSGDMVLGALFSLGVSPAEVESGIRSLGIEEFSIGSAIVDRSGISSVKALVDAPDAKNHRHLPEIEKMIDGSSLSSWVKNKSKEIFRNLAVAESRVHGIPLEKVHFHEVGALDSIIDVVGSCIGFEILGATRFTASKLHVGSGFVDMAHGKFPVPPPAVAELLKEIPFYSTEIEGELVTPTGAAIVATLSESFGDSDAMRISATGYGAGGRDYKDFPNTLRIMIGEQADAGDLEIERLVMIETNLDDMDGESLAYAMEKLFMDGALDCWLTPIQMKKGRPANMLSVLSRPGDASRLGEIVLNETTSIGYRLQDVTRTCLPRTERSIPTPYGELAVKIVDRPNGSLTFKVEHEVLKQVATSRGTTLREARALINSAVQDHLDEGKR